MEDKARLGALVRAMAEEFDSMADEYEQRIKDYQETLDEVNSALSEMPASGSGTGNPDSLMPEFLMEEEELEDSLEEAFPDGLREGVKVDDSTLLAAREAVEALRQMRDDLERSMDDPVYSGLRDLLITLRDVLDAALTENKADYARLLMSIERLGEFWEFTE